MRLGDFDQVEALVSTRNHLIGLRDEGRVRIELGARMMDPDFSQAVRPAIVAELERRIGAIDAELAKLGVEVG